jgi:hypothetical protein
MSLQTNIVVSLSTGMKIAETIKLEQTRAISIEGAKLFIGDSLQECFSFLQIKEN